MNNEYLRLKNEEYKAKLLPTCVDRSFVLVGEDGFEPSKSLTTDLQSAPFGHSGIPPYSVVLIAVRVELVDGLEPPTC